MVMFSFALKSELNATKEALQQRLEKRKHKLKEIRSSLKVFQDYLRSECLDVDTVLSSVMGYVEKAKSHALSPMNEKNLGVEKQAKEATEKLNEEIKKLRGKISDLERISNLEDHIDFLQVRKTFFCVKCVRLLVSD
ncbi:hypothetical protein N1851_019536 [Merluccius polli]|uniref:TRIM8/14/16/25/29/45/65 coiled-coil region domain-containing protein n=1 Tax=Merluccius polli TaxID=89951 RepID=A0AA47NZ49_MERPO|nr:hypothetical protein N1851_019536 [Merluccius polli]